MDRSSLHGARRRRPHLFVLLIAGLIAGLFQSFLTLAQSPAVVHRADAIVLVNQSSASYNDFPRYIQPYLDHFGIPYTIVNINSAPVPADIGNYALIVLGHNGLDQAGTLLDAGEQSLISSAVNAGTGLLNFDSDLADGNTPRYSFIQNIFGFGYTTSGPSTAAQMNTAPTIGAFVMAMQPANATYTFLDVTTPRGVTPGANAATLATLGGSPLLVAANYGQGRALQWTSYGWIRTSIWGPVHGLDDLIWRGAVWAARKPFVLQGLPNFVTFRVDDSTGPYTWADIAANRGFKIWNGFFMNDQDAQDIADMRTLIQEHKMTASVHARTGGNWFYFNHVNGVPWSDAVMNQNWADAMTFHAVNNLPKSKFVVPHFYEFGINSFAGLETYGAEFVGTVQTINQTHIGDVTLLGGPYCQYQVPCVPGQAPIYYSHFLSVPGHPEFDGKFFNVLTEIRDNAGYEWYPSNDVATTVSRGVTQLTRAFKGMNLATLFTHEYLIQPISLSNWDAIVTGVRDGIAGYNPTYVTMDYAAQYVRAMVTSNIASSVYDVGTGDLQTTLSGKTDLITQFHVFYDQSGSIQTALVDVPVFNGSATVNFNLLNPSTPTPTSAVTATPSPTALESATPTPSPTPADGSIQINVYEDNHQDPVLATTSNGGDLNTADNQWTEFLFPPRGYAGVFAGTDETPPLMRFYATVPNGTYTLTANLYRNNDVRYYWGLSAANPQQFSYDVISGTVGQFSEHVLGVVTVSNGTFELYINNADALNGSNPLYGWAWLRLTPNATPGTPIPTATETATPNGATLTPTPSSTPALPTDTATPSVTPSPTPVDGSIQINVYEDNHQDPVLASTSNGSDLNVTDNLWTEFLFPPRGYAGVFAGTEETPPLMRFYANVPNGTYTLVANLYRNNDLRYYWGYTATQPQQFSYDVISGTIGQFSEHVLDTVTVSNGVFELYVNNGDALSGSNPLYGWAWLRLIPALSTPTVTATPLPSLTPTSSPTLPPTSVDTATPTPSETPLPVNTTTPTQPPSDTPIPTPIDTATATTVPSVTPLPSATACVMPNIATAGTAYRWWGMTASISNTNRVAEARLNDGNPLVDINLHGSGDDSASRWEAAGVIWSTPRNLVSMSFYNGAADDISNSLANGEFSANVKMQFSTDGVTWADSNWPITPAYIGNDITSTSKWYIFTGGLNNVLGVRVVGQVRTAAQFSWHANVNEVEARDGCGAIPPTSTPTVTATSTPSPTASPTRTPTGTAIPTATRTSSPTPTMTGTATAIASPTATATASATPTPGGNQAPSGTTYRWYGLSTSNANTNRTTEARLKDGNLLVDINLRGSGDDSASRWEAAGVLWSTPHNINSIKFWNGACDNLQLTLANGYFTANLRAQYTLDGTTWLDAASWISAPAYPYNTLSACSQYYTLSGSTLSNVLGVRVAGQVHTGGSYSWHANVNEVEAY